MIQRAPTDVAGERSHLCEEPRPLLPAAPPLAWHLHLDEPIATPGTVSANGALPRIHGRVETEREREREKKSAGNPPHLVAC
jgi:hypothetical protein